MVKGILKIAFIFLIGFSILADDLFILFSECSYSLICEIETEKSAEGEEKEQSVDSEAKEKYQHWHQLAILTDWSLQSRIHNYFYKASLKLSKNSEIDIPPPRLT